MGLMVDQSRFSRPTMVVLDGDQDPAPGCLTLPGSDAPERVVFEAIASVGWTGVAQQVGRSHSDLVDAATAAMTNPDHHDWVRQVGDVVLIGGNELWRAMVASWLQHCGADSHFAGILDHVDELLEPR